MGCVRFGIKMANPVIFYKRFIKRLNLFALK